MIVYFSATGNSRHIAESIAEALNDTAVSIEDTASDFTLSDGENFGIITPVYWWQLSLPMREYLNNLTLKNSSYTYLVVTYGTTPGCCGEDARKILKKRGIELNASFSIRMPDNFTPIFDLSDPVKVKTELLFSEAQTSSVIRRIRSMETGDNTERKTPYAVRLVMNPMYNYERNTKHFYAENSCIGCGICAKNCPVQAIEIVDNKPVWIKKQCALCLRCLHHCPEFAIQFTQGFSKKHGQYIYPVNKN